MTTSFSDLRRRAEAGETLTVVFLGGSLTWGANSTDPERTSYRAIVAHKLAQRWPKARWNCIDSSIGGTGSRLAIFRFLRDVARHKPDLVFLDHTVNDGGPGILVADRLASIEAVIRSCVLDLKVPTILMLLAAGDMVLGDITQQPIRAAHLALAKAYQVPVGDAIEQISSMVRAGKYLHSEIWDDPKDGVHPGDLGYTLYADAAWLAFMGALEADAMPSAPRVMLHADTYRTVVRSPLADLLPLPVGWEKMRPTRISAWYDSLMSRWLDRVAVASVSPENGHVAPWDLVIHGCTILLFGESTINSGKIRVFVDGKLTTSLKDGILDCRSFVGGTFKLDPTIAVGLEPGVEHRLRLEPFDDREGFSEWRIESICVAGPGARVRNLHG